MHSVACCLLERYMKVYFEFAFNQHTVGSLSDLGRGFHSDIATTATDFAP